MKKLIIPMLMLYIGHAGTVSAEDTDVSAIDNVIYIESFQASPGTTELELSIKMKNTAAIRGFQFDLELPEGVTPVEEDGEYVYWLNANRAPKQAGGQFFHTLEVTRQDDGTYRFLSGAQKDKTFTGNDGEVAVFLINIAADMAVGDHPITMRYVKLTETDINNYYLTDEVISTLTITDGGTARVVLDETSTTAPAVSDGPVDVHVKRTIKANEWSTLCLPFAMTAEQIQTAFGSDATVELADAVSYDTTEDDDENIVGITINFNNVTAIEANHPYIIKVSSAITSFDVDGVVINPATTVSGRRKKIGNGSYFIGNYENQTEVPEFCLFLNGNKFWYSTGATKMKAFRGYFSLRDVLTEVDEAAARISFSFGEATGITINNRETITNNRYYDLQGRRVSVGEGDMPAHKGLYIKNGKKEIVK